MKLSINTFVYIRCLKYVSNLWTRSCIHVLFSVKWVYIHRGHTWIGHTRIFFMYDAACDIIDETEWLTDHFGVCRNRKTAEKSHNWLEADAVGVCGATSTFPFFFIFHFRLKHSFDCLVNAFDLFELWILISRLWRVSILFFWLCSVRDLTASE